MIKSGYTCKAILSYEKDNLVIYPVQKVSLSFSVIDWLEGYWRDTLSSATKDSCVFRIVYHEYLEDEFGDGWAQEYLKTDSPEELVPILHILSGVELHPEMYNPIEFPRSARLLDSSIWNYCIWDDKEGNGYEDRLARVLSEIYHNWELRLYRLGASVEYADLNARLSENSFFRGGHHAERISPFLFHSEYWTRQSLKKRLGEWKDQQGNAFCFGQRWRFLLVDDHAVTVMSERGKDTALEGGRTKLDIVLERLRSLEKDGYPIRLAWRNPSGTGWSGEISSFDIAIDWVSSLPDFVERLFGERSMRYDIILLDYLLGDTEYFYDFLYLLKSLCSLIDKKDLCRQDILKARQESEAHFLTVCEDGKNTEILPIDISNDNLVLYGRVSCPIADTEILRSWILDAIGPMRRLYFMYISSFVHAIQERLEEQRISRADKYWYIGRGACPVNTPEVFLFNLHVLMEKRFRKIVEPGNAGEFKGVPEFLSRIFDKRKENRASVKSDCRRLFPELLRLKAIYENLALDLKMEDQRMGLDARGSILLNSIFEDWTLYTPAFWEHLQHLCYLIGFGTGRQWPEWWEEFLFIQPVLNGKPVETRIKEYIIGFTH